MAGIKGKVSVKDLQKFQAGLNKMNKVQRQKWNEDALKELAARLLTKAKKRTPVDSGHLRREWTIGTVTKSGDTYAIEVINPVEYAPYVEFGHRTPDHSGWVDGRFMLTISETELEQDAPKILINKLKKFMGGVFS